MAHAWKSTTPSCTVNNIATAHLSQQHGEQRLFHAVGTHLEFHGTKQHNREHNHIPHPTAKLGSTSCTTHVAYAWRSMAPSSTFKYIVTAHISQLHSGAQVVPHMWHTPGIPWHLAAQSSTQSLPTSHSCTGEHKLYHTCGIRLEVHSTRQHSQVHNHRPHLTVALGSTCCTTHVAYAWNSMAPSSTVKYTITAHISQVHWGAQVVPHTWHTPGSPQHQAAQSSTQSPPTSHSCTGEHMLYHTCGICLEVHSTRQHSQVHSHCSHLTAVLGSTGCTTHVAYARKPTVPCFHGTPKHAGIKCQLTHLSPPLPLCTNSVTHIFQNSVSHQCPVPVAYSQISSSPRYAHFLLTDSHPSAAHVFSPLNRRTAHNDLVPPAQSRRARSCPSSSPRVSGHSSRPYPRHGRITLINQTPRGCREEGTT